MCFNFLIRRKNFKVQDDMKLVFVFILIVALSLCVSGAEIRLKRSENHNGALADESITPTLQEKQCVPGTRWMNDCNNCFCTDTGFGICTLRGCLHTDFMPTRQDDQKNRRERSISENHFDASHERIQPAVPKSDCVAGTTWMDDCNRCWCTSNGFKACTLMGCFSLDIIPKRQVSLKRDERSIDTPATPKNPISEAKCKHGDSWMHDCNRCHCVGGLAACTRMMCPNFVKLIKV